MKLSSTVAARSCTASWVALLGLTTISFLLGSRVPSQVLMATVLVLTLLKGQLVVNDFMGLRTVRPLWRIVMGAYLLAVGGAIALAYLTA